MEPRIPDVEIFVALKWILILMLTSGLMTFAGLIVKRWWYGSEKHNRREDEMESRGWIERFLKLQESHTQNTLDLRDEMHGVRDELKSNGDAIRDLSRSWECKYPEHRR